MVFDPEVHLVKKEAKMCNQHEVLDAAFFDDHTLTVLLQEQWSGPDSVAVVCQLPLGPLADHTFLPLTSQDVPLDQRPQM